MKRYQVYILCRQLSSAHAHYTYTVDATRFDVAVYRALRMFRQERMVKRRKLVCLEIRATKVGVLGLKVA